MRDPKRIEEMQEALVRCWKLAPDIRFGQLISNIHHMYANGRDMFYIEDDQWLEWINLYTEYCKINYVIGEIADSAQQLGEAIKKIVDKNNSVTGD